MPYHPCNEPIVALDDINKQDIEALDTPVQRSFEMIAESYQQSNEPVTRYFAIPGKEKDYICNLLHSFRQKYTFSIFEVHSFSSVALVRDIQHDKQTASVGKDEEAYSHLAEACCDLGCGPGLENPVELPCGAEKMTNYDNELLQCIQKEKLQSFLSYQKAVAEMVDEYSSAHGQIMYIQFIATEKSMQGKGLASRLLKYLVAAADAERKDVYLEATTEKTRMFFEKEHGFFVWKEYDVASEEEEGSNPVVKDENREIKQAVIMAMVRPFKTS